MSREKSAVDMNNAVLRITGMNRALLESTSPTLAEETNVVAGAPDTKPMRKRGENAAFMTIPAHQMPSDKPEGGVEDGGELDSEPETIGDAQEEGCGDTEESSTYATVKGQKGAIAAAMQRDSKLIAQKKRDEQARKAKPVDQPTMKVDSKEHNFDLMISEAADRIHNSTKTSLLVETKNRSQEKVMANRMFDTTGIKSLSEWRNLAGLESLDESQHVPEPRTGHSGEVPSGQNTKSNKMKGGLPGLEGGSVQAIEPKEVPGDDEVGDDEEATFDDAIAMLKKEGIDQDDLWAVYLEDKGLTVDIFSQLIDAAALSEDTEEIGSILAVEDMFQQWVMDSIMAMSEELTRIQKLAVVSANRRGAGSPTVQDTAVAAKQTNAEDAARRQAAALNRMNKRDDRVMDTGENEEDIGDQEEYDLKDLANEPVEPDAPVRSLAARHAQLSVPRRTHMDVGRERSQAAIASAPKTRQPMRVQDLPGLGFPKR